MSSHGYATPLVFEPRPSRFLVTLWSGAWIVAAVAILLLSPAWVLALLPAASLSAWLEWRRIKSASRLEWCADGSWRVATPRGERTLQLAPGTFCTPWLVVLVCRSGVFGVRRVVARDALDPVTWRRLRARLRIEGSVCGNDVRR